MIQLCGLTKDFGRFTAVRDVSFNIADGEICGFLGVNGAGKTTTLRMLAGILRPTRGSAVVGGYDLLRESLKAKAVTGYVPDRPNIYPKLTGREFLEFIADLYSVGAPGAKRIDLLLDEYRLTDWQFELIESYSHGMRQRLALCAGLIHEPKVLLVDEPTVGLDPHGAKLLKARLRSYAEAGMSILLSTHSLNVAEEIADRIVLINRGAIIAQGSLTELRHQAGLGEERLEEVFLKLTLDDDE